MTDFMADFMTEFMAVYCLMMGIAVNLLLTFRLVVLRFLGVCIRGINRHVQGNQGQLISIERMSRLWKRQVWRTILLSRVASNRGYGRLQLQCKCSCRPWTSPLLRRLLGSLPTLNTAFFCTKSAQSGPRDTEGKGDFSDTTDLLTD
jgi:hypothetical protein